MVPKNLNQLSDIIVEINGKMLVMADEVLLPGLLSDQVYILYTSSLDLVSSTLLLDNQ